MKNTLAVKDDSAVTMTIDPAAQSMSVQQVLGQVALIQQIMAAAMQEGVHFGRIPGCGDTPVLLKPGAEKLCLTFRLAPTYEVKERLLEGGHREYSITCTLSSILSGAKIGQGVGFGSTMESKYRFRKGDAEPTDKPVPRAYWDIRQEDPAKAQELIGGKGFSVKKVDGKGWMIARGGELVENTNPANETNTVLKMTKKRALVDAVLTATAASDLMTQDLEDITANMATHQPQVISAAAGGGSVSVDTPSIPSPVDSGADASGGPAAAEQFEPVGETDFMSTRIHFGKNRGLMLSELNPQQTRWYLEDWMPKKEVNGPTSVEDLALINALKGYCTKPKGGQASVPTPR